MLPSAKATHPGLNRPGDVWVLDTNVVVALTKMGRYDILARGCVHRGQLPELARVWGGDTLLTTIPGPRSADQGLVGLAQRGYVIVTMDRVLARKIRRVGGRVHHLKDAVHMSRP